MTFLVPITECFATAAKSRLSGRVGHAQREDGRFAAAWHLCSAGIELALGPVLGQPAGNNPRSYRLGDLLDPRLGSGP